MLAGGPPLVLASGSATRAALLTAAGLRFTIVRPLVDEEDMREALAADGASGEDAAVALAELKARRGSDLGERGSIVLGADQLLDLDGRWLAKPTNRDDARAQLQALRGRSHRLVTACVAFRGGSRVWHDVSDATLSMRAFDDTFLERYLDVVAEEAFQSVGGYKLEGMGAHLMARVRGDHSTILGLSMLPLLDFLRVQGVIAS